MTQTTTPEAIISRLTAALDAEEAQARQRLCISCGHRTQPLRNAFGITGYTHDSWNPETETRDGWEGLRCPNRLTGAEPVQNPERRLREVAAHREIVDRYAEALLDLDRARRKAPSRPLGDTDLLDCQQEAEFLRPIVEIIAAIYEETTT